MGYEVILLDADGTLLDYDRAEEFAFQRTVRLFFGTNNTDYLPEYRFVNQIVWEEFEDGRIRAQDINQERFQRFFTRMKLDAHPLSFSQEYLQALSSAAFLLDGARELLTALNKYQLILVTNGLSFVQHSRLTRASVKEYFASIIISEEVGVAKPQAGIFVKALESVDHRKKETVLMVGDNLNSDIQGGQKFGIDTCWYNPNQVDNKSPFKPTYEIHHLDELPGLLQ